VTNKSFLFIINLGRNDINVTMINSIGKGQVPEAKSQNHFIKRRLPETDEGKNELDKAMSEPVITEPDDFESQRASICKSTVYKGRTGN
jgi:hypothetical protein